MTFVALLFLLFLFSIILSQSNCSEPHVSDVDHELAELINVSINLHFPVHYGVNLMEAVKEATDDHFQSANYTQIDAWNLTTVMFQMSRNSVSWEADFDTCFSSIRLHL